MLSEFVRGIESVQLAAEVNAANLLIVSRSQRCFARDGLKGEKSEVWSRFASARHHVARNRPILCAYIHFYYTAKLTRFWAHRSGT